MQNIIDILQEDKKSNLLIISEKDEVIKSEKINFQQLESSSKRHIHDLTNNLDKMNESEQEIMKLVFEKDRLLNNYKEHVKENSIGSKQNPEYNLSIKDVENSNMELKIIEVERHLVEQLHMVTELNR